MNAALRFTYRSHGVYPFTLWSLAARSVPLRAANTFACNDNWSPLTDWDIGA